MAYLHIFVCKSTLEGRNQSSSIFHVLIQSVQQFVRCRIKGRYHNCLVLIQILRFRPYKITFHIHSIQSVVHPAHYIIVADSTVSGCPRCLVLDTKPFQCSKCFIAHKHCHIIFLFQIYQMLSKTGKLISNYAGFPVSRIFLEIMTEKPLPVSFAGIMNRMPMPVHHAVCARCQVAVRLQTQLTFIGGPAWKSLCFRFKHQVIVLLQGADQISAKCNLCSCKVILCRMINIGSCNRQASGSMEMINIWLHSIRKSTPLKIKIMCNKLILSFVFIHNICLPAKEPVNQGSLEFFKFCAKASIDRTTYIREIFPGIDPIAPIVKAEFII